MGAILISWFAGSERGAAAGSRSSDRLFGLAEQANSQIHHAYAGPLRTQSDAALATVRAALSPVVFAEAFAAGQQLSLKEAFATILHPAAIAA